MTITLESIKTAHEKVAEMIAQFEANAPRMRLIQKAEIALQLGEEYAGIIIGKDGEPDYHLVLLPGQASDINWLEAQTWAKTVGGALPTRREQSLLFANLKEKFDHAWYWSGTQHADDSGFAWGQHFFTGYQGYFLKSFQGRARAVRRLIIL